MKRTPKLPYISSASRSCVSQQTVCTTTQKYFETSAEVRIQLVNMSVPAGNETVLLFFCLLVTNASLPCILNCTMIIGGRRAGGGGPGGLGPPPPSPGYGAPFPPPPIPKTTSTKRLQHAEHDLASTRVS